MQVSLKSMIIIEYGLVCDRDEMAEWIDVTFYSSMDSDSIYLTHSDEIHSTAWVHTPIL